MRSQEVGAVSISLEPPAPSPANRDGHIPPIWSVSRVDLMWELAGAGSV